MPERADAARNRQRILAAAEELAATEGADGLSMDQVAAAAGVGVGTVYRRFGDRSGLAYAMLDGRERIFQEAFLHGPPPLGPGAPPRDRVRAFLHAYAQRTDDQLDLLLVAEAATPTARTASGAYGAARTHLAALVAEVRPGVDAGYLADVLLAPLAASLFAHQRRDRAMSLDRITAGLDLVVDGLLPPPP